MDKKKRYSIFQNIQYALANIWRWDKRYYLAFIPKIPLSIFFPLAMIYFPALLINMIEQNVSDTTLLLHIGIYSAMLVTMGIIQLFCDARITSTQYVFSFLYNGEVGYKTYTMDFAHTENPKIANMKEHSHSGGDSGENMPKDINRFLINLLGIFTFGTIIGTLNLLILLLLIVSTCINYAVLAYVRNYTDKNRDKWVGYDRKGDYLYELSRQYEHAKDIKIYNMRPWLLALTQQYQSLRMKWHKKTNNKELLAGLVDAGLQFIRDGVAYAVLIGMFLNDYIDLGSFIFYFGAIAGFSNWLSSIIGQFNAIATHSDNINRLREYLNVEDTFNHGEGIALPKEVPYEITFKNVSYTYPHSEKAILDNLNFTIEKGEKIAIVGVNGAGKTTLVKLMCGLYQPTSGQVLLAGNDAKEYNIDDYYTQFSAVFQDINLMPVPIVNYLAGSFEKVDREKAYAALKLAGLDTRINKLPNGIDTTLVKGIFDDGIDLSGGEKQKLMLARALYKDAPVIVLDEPTAALDPIAENELYLKYAELTQGKTSVYISHR